MSLLDIKNLSVRFGDTTAVPVVDGLDLNVDKGEVLAIVGESGSGKSVTMMALMGLIDAPGWVSADHLRFDGHDMLTLKGRQRRRIVGKDMAMVFQDPMTALNPSYTVGYQIEEVLRLHLGLRGKALRQRALELLERVEIPAAASRLDAYPHQLSGGMSQRVAIAMAIAAEPKLLIADEPTSALDVSIQAQVLNLFMDLQQQFRTAYVFISHNLAVVRHVADDVLVMYLGRPAEMGPADKLYENPLHPYTRALLSATPAIHPDPTKPKIRIQGELPNPLHPPEGCAFHKRCPYATERCRSEVPELRLLDQRQVACHHAEQFLG
ncbi:ABC transporter ATP-binding protein [Pseudomonas aeruginosa]